MFKIALRYLKYIISSGHRKGHGIHSPFVFSFVRNVLLNDFQAQVPDSIIKWHRIQKKNSKEIFTEKAGEKSFINSSNYRTIGEMVRNSSIREKYGKLLFRLVNYYRPELIIELGTGLGISTAYLISSLKGGRMISIEASEQKLEFARKELEALGMGNIDYICDRFDNALQDLTIKGKKSLVFIDGNHNYESTIKYFRHFKRQAGENSILVFDDIHWSDGMVKAWKEICGDEDVSISINLFFFGIVFFKKVKINRHYNIKF